ncbi:uncharacterized protein LOC110730797 [Chenopodium quinoa]|uniref:uncharacterized protein LOC110730797 n=1 Tax=Chenopodium quinoa TaxID=63459 RepID=UPI000B788C25|nr:uncharacterized protein LOC110730797 [Chenopodium quinoa]
MQKEIDALTANNTWVLVPLPKEKKLIGCKWVFKVKLKADGTVERLKARLVAKGFTQKYGIDYLETFSPVVKMTTKRCILSLAASQSWKIHQLDLNNAFLHGELHEEVYMKVPEGIIKDLGLLNFFLGIEITHLPAGILMTQKKFTRELLQGCQMDISNVDLTPLPTYLKLQADVGEFYHDPELYRSLVGKLNFLSHTRPDISFSVQTLSQFLSQSRTHHATTLNHVLRYVAHTQGQGILLRVIDKLTL